MAEAASLHVTFRCEEMPEALCGWLGAKADKQLIQDQLFTMTESVDVLNRSSFVSDTQEGRVFPICFTSYLLPIYWVVFCLSVIFIESCFHCYLQLRTAFL